MKPGYIKLPKIDCFDIIIHKKYLPLVTFRYNPDEEVADNE